VWRYTTIIQTNKWTNISYYILTQTYETKICKLFGFAISYLMKHTVCAKFDIYVFTTNDWLFVLLFFFFWPLCCLVFFDLRILITPLVSSNSSYLVWSYAIWYCIVKKSNQHFNIWAWTRLQMTCTLFAVIGCKNVDIEFSAHGVFHQVRDCKAK
jgi:hypothetical protein